MRILISLFRSYILVMLASVTLGQVNGGLKIIDMSAEPEFSDSDLRSLNSLWESLVDVTNLKIYEGLPHPFWDKALFESEKEKMLTVTLHGERFYASANPVTPSSQGKIVRTLQSTDIYLPMEMSPKQCGGFHADFALVWEYAKRQYCMMVCFGCSEIRAHGTDFSIETDLSEAGRHRLREILEEFSEKRPRGTVAY